MNDNRPVPVLTKVGDGWVVRWDIGNGKPQVFNCATEEQAKKLIATLLMNAQEPPNKPQS